MRDILTSRVFISHKTEAHCSVLYGRGSAGGCGRPYPHCSVVGEWAVMNSIWQGLHL